MKFVLFVLAVIAIGVVATILIRKNRKTRNDATEEMGAKMNGEVPVQPLPMLTQEVYEGQTEELFIPQTRQDLSSLVISDSLPFAEEIRILRYMCEKYPNEVQMDLYNPASAITISFFEQRQGVRLSDELRALYSFANGMDLCGMMLSFDSLQIIEGFSRRGYNNFKNEADKRNYIVMGSVLGGEGSIVLEKKTGDLLRYNEGEFTNFRNVTGLLHWLIEFAFDSYIQNDDAVVKGYLRRM